MPFMILTENFRSSSFTNNPNLNFTPTVVTQAPPQPRPGILHSSLLLNINFHLLVVIPTQLTSNLIEKEKIKAKSVNFIIQVVDYKD